MGDPLKNTESTLTQSPLKNKTRIIENREIEFERFNLAKKGLVRDTTRPGVMIGGVYHTYPPFNNDERIIWAVKMAFRELVLETQYNNLGDALDKLEEGKAKFLGGAVVGFVKGIKEEIELIIKISKELVVDGIARFYSLVYDVGIYSKIIDVMKAPPGSKKELREVESYLKENHPEVWMALSSLKEVYDSALKKLYEVQEKIVEVFNDSKLVVDIFEKIIDYLKDLILYDEKQGASRIATFVSMKGNPFDQGSYIGVIIGSFVFAVISFIDDIATITKSILRISRKLITKFPEVAKSLSGVLAKSIDDAKPIKEAVEVISKEAVKINERIARKTMPYKLLKRETDLYNKHVAAVTLFSGKPHPLGPSIEYIGLRLDADHILEDRIYKWFEADFKKLKINAADEMDAIAIQTEFHIRSGEGLIETFKMEIPDEWESVKTPGLKVKSTLPDLKSLTEMKMNFIGSDKSKYSSLQSLVEKYEALYKTQIPAYYEQMLQKWFKELKEKMRSAGIWKDPL